MPLKFSDMPPHILLIEDERSIADSVLYALKTEGYQASWAETGRDALKLFDQTQPSLVVLDIGLPDMSGLDVCRELRKKGQTPIIFLTARGEDIDRIVGLELGADDYMAKPFSPRELTARIRAVLRRSTPPISTEEPMQYGPFRHDAERRRIEYQGVPLALTRYEYRLLKTLLERPGKIYSREQLMDKAWEHPDHSLDRTVDTHIKTLRSKLHAVHPGEDLIRTHRGMGYSLEIPA
ncbi:MAG: two-component system response regulator CreB [Nevskiales bacterium]